MHLPDPLLGQGDSSAWAWGAASRLRSSAKLPGTQAPASLLSSRSTSYTFSSRRPDSSSSGRSSRRAWTQSNRASMRVWSISGASTQVLSRRPPMAVRVLSSTCSRCPWCWPLSALEISGFSGSGQKGHAVPTRPLHPVDMRKRHLLGVPQVADQGACRGQGQAVPRLKAKGLGAGGLKVRKRASLARWGRKVSGRTWLI